MSRVLQVAVRHQAVRNAARLLGCHAAIIARRSRRWLSTVVTGANQVPDAASQKLKSRGEPAGRVGLINDDHAVAPPASDTNDNGRFLLQPVSWPARWRYSSPAPYSLAPVARDALLPLGCGVRLPTAPQAG